MPPAGYPALQYLQSVRISKKESGLTCPAPARRIGGRWLTVRDRPAVGST